MKKTFKRAGVAVLSMAMLLSMGAATALTSSAATPQNVTITKGTEYSYSYSKIASLADDLVHYTIVTEWGTAGLEVDGSNYIAYKSTSTPAVSGKFKFADYTTAADKQKLALDLANKTDTWTSMASNTVSLAPGYYIFKSASAQPILLEVKDSAVTGKEAKATVVSLDKTITGITAPNTNAAADDLVDTTGKNGLVEAGATVAYKLETNFPVYDRAALVNGTDYKNITDFTITDIPEDTLTINKGTDFAGIVVKKKSSADSDYITLIKGTDYTIADASDGDVAATDKTSGEKYFKSTNASNDTTTASAGFKITFKDKTVLDNLGAAVTVEFNATVSAAPDVNNDKNRNSSVVEYNNNYFTGGYNETTPGTPDEPNKHDGSDADVYCTLLTVNKVDQDNAALTGATFELYKGNSATGTPIMKIGKTASPSTDVSSFEFKGLDIGTYTLHESNTPSAEYVAANDITFVITESGWNGSFTFTNTSDATVYTDGAITVENTKGQTLPGTGGMGTILFTVGGAAIVLLAGALFVLYMRKRETEE